MSEEQKPSGGIVEELNVLGQQLGLAVKSLWQSEDALKLRQDLSQGFVELGQHLDAAVKSAQESEAAKQFSTQFKETVDKARGTEWVDKVEQGIVSGLQELNAQLAKMVSSFEGPKTTDEEPKTETQA